MAGSNRWTKSTGSTAQASTGPNHVPNEDKPYHSEDSEHQPRPEGYAARKSREVPHFMDRTLETRPHEDHMEFCFAFRQQCAWHNDKEFVKLSVERGIHTIKGPANMSPFCRRQMAMDSVSRCHTGRNVMRLIIPEMASRVQSIFDWLASSR